MLTKFTCGCTDLYKYLTNQIFTPSERALQLYKVPSRGKIDIINNHEIVVGTYAQIHELRALRCGLDGRVSHVIFMDPSFHSIDEQTVQNYLRPKLFINLISENTFETKMQPQRRNHRFLNRRFWIETLEEENSPIE